MTSSAQLTYSGILLAVFANQICLPIPAVVFLMAGGAVSARGGMRLSIIVSLGVLGCLAGDAIWFCFGRRWGSQALRLFCRFTANPRQCSRDAHEKFHRYGPSILCVAKFVPGLDGITPPLVGAQGVSMARFLTFDAIGSALWSGAYVAVGYVFSNQLEIAIDLTKRFGTALAIAIGLPITLWASWRALTLLRMVRRLKLRRIDARMLNRKLKSSKKVAVLDLLDFEAEIENESLAAIPGALRVNPSRLRNSPQITVPDDVDVVLYSSSGRDIVSARVAMALQRIGIKKVWVLEGGLRAWREHGFGVSQCLEAPERFAERLGVRLPPV